MFRLDRSGLVSHYIPAIAKMQSPCAGARTDIYQCVVLPSTLIQLRNFCPDQARTSAHSAKTMKVVWIIVK